MLGGQLNHGWKLCYERDLMMYLSYDKQAGVIDALTLHPDIWTIF